MFFVKLLKRIVLIAVCVCFVSAALVFGVNAYVINSVKDTVVSPEQAAQIEDVDCIIVLGCLVRNSQTPSHMLEDRLITGVELFNSGAAPKLLMSGDHGRKAYDEVNVMKNFAVERGVDSQDVFMDHAGFSTYESMYRSKEIFAAKKVIIVTQSYHLSRALYDARAVGLEAYGVAADRRSYGKAVYNNVRESAARAKDFVYCIIKPEPTYLGEVIPISGNGDSTAG